MGGLWVPDAAISRSLGEANRREFRTDSTDAGNLNGQGAHYGGHVGIDECGYADARHDRMIDAFLAELIADGSARSGRAADLEAWAAWIAQTPVTDEPCPASASGLGPR